MSGPAEQQRLVESFAPCEVPGWVRSFDGPFQDVTCDKGRVLQDVFAAGDRKLAWFKLAEEHMQGHLSNIAVPMLRYREGRAEVVFGVLIGDVDDAMRLAEENPAKDPGNIPLPVQSLPVQPDATKWRSQRQRIADVFVPGTSLAGMVPTLQEGVSQLLHRWGGLGVIEAHRELHHATLDLFLRAMCGVRDVLPPDPEASAEIRGAFNLEAIPNPDEALRGMPTRLLFAQEVLQAPTETPGRLLEHLRAIDDQSERLAEMVAFLVAGHDTTAHALEWALLELARHPEVQEACRAEADAVLAEVEAQARSPSYEDLPKFGATTAVITEVLRLWGPAWVVFWRELTAGAQLRGRDGPVTVPAGTPVNFWFYGHHHSKQLWGEDADEFRPFGRSFTDSEVQRNTSRTPCSGRYHPFSLPSRDCLGKNFSLMEMRLLLPQLLRRFHVGLAEPSLSAVQGLACGRGEPFFGQARRPGPIKPPPNGELWLRLTPRSSPSRL